MSEAAVSTKVVGQHEVESGPRQKGGSSMAKCVTCGADTILFVNGTPFCTKCDDQNNRGSTQGRI